MLEAERAIPLGAAWALLSLAACGGGEREPPPEPSVAPVSVAGRWDVTVEAGEVRYPSWFELSGTGSGLAGRFVGRAGSARPIAHVSFDGEELRFRLPPQYEERDDDIQFVGRLSAEIITGETSAADGRPLPFEAVGRRSWSVPGSPPGASRSTCSLTIPRAGARGIRNPRTAGASWTGSWSTRRPASTW
jgi:hypothetical protein